MAFNSAGYYVFPPCWVGGEPLVEETGAPPTDELGPRDLAAAREEVYRARLRAGIAVRVLREGMIAFDFSDWPVNKALTRTQGDSTRVDSDKLADAAARRMEVLNAHYICLRAAITRQRPAIYPHQPPSEYQRHFMESLDDEWRLFDIRNQSPGSSDRHRVLTVAVEVMEESFWTLDQVLDLYDQNAVQFLDLLLRSWRAFEDNEYSLALNSAWTLTEGLLSTFWKRYLEENRRRATDMPGRSFINNERLENLVNGRDYSASVVTEILSLTDQLPFSVYTALSKARAARNKWIHDLKRATLTDAANAINVAHVMFHRVFGIDVFQYGLPVPAL